MGNYVITTDNGSDFSEKTAKENGIDMVYLRVNLEGKEYDGEKEKIEPEKVYELMKKGVTPSTSQVNPEQAQKFFDKYLKAGQNVIHVCLSSKISGTYNSCKMAAENIKQRYPDRKIEVIDSISASMGMGLLLMHAVEKKRDGATFDEVVEYIEETKHKVCHIFTVSDLVYLQRGGRISKAEAVIGSLIGIKPVLSCDSEGKLVPIFKVRGRKNSLIAMVDKMEEMIIKKENKFVTISHGGCEEEAEYVARLIRERIGIKRVIIEGLGPVIGSHSGPGTLAVFCIAKERIDRK